MRKLALSCAALAAFLLGIVGCNSSTSGGGLFGSVLAPTFRSAPQADVSGQTDVFQGTLGSGVVFTFSAIQGVQYNMSATTQPSGETLVFDVFSRSGSQLAGKDFTTNPGQNGINYAHRVESQHVLVLLRPNNPLNTSVNVTSLRVTGIGLFSKTLLPVNVIVAGDDFAGFNAFNDLKTGQDRANLAQSLLQKVQAKFTQGGTGITVQFNNAAPAFTITSADVKASQPTLVDSQNRTICRTSESVNGQGYSDIDVADLDRWGAFGIPETSSTQVNANGLDVFIIHHFATDGVVGLSPRPGTKLRGNGAGSALCVGAFLQLGGKVVSARSVDDMAVVMTHEIGHFLGLLHTSTFSPVATAGQVKETIDDGLSDTPAAVASGQQLKDTNGDGVIGIGDGLADEPYVMFYQNVPGQSLFSPRQIAVMQNVLSSMEH